MKGRVTFNVSVTLSGTINDPDGENADAPLRERLAEALEGCPDVVIFKIEDATIDGVY